MMTKEAVQEIIKSQYGASLKMLGQAIETCPPALWHDPGYQNPFWHIAYHALFYTHLYLSPTEEHFRPWDKHRDEFVSLEETGNPERAPYTQEDLLAYLAFCHDHMAREVDALDLAAESGFYWLPFTKLELQFYNIRHLMEHTGELGERLGAMGEVEIDWVGMAR